jgi:ATP-dependent helicase/nuclease subunit A
MAFTLTAEQQIASDPQHSVWVTANAGTGKTKILTDRVLRLMLQGTPIHRILCLTFTKAAAAEMHERIAKQLRTWAVTSDDELTAELIALCDQAPSAKTTNIARTLFMTVTNNPDELNIKTIHGFCQSLLKRFPLEAGLTPHFTIIEDQTAKELLSEAWLRILNKSAHDKILNTAIQVIANTAADSTLGEIITEITSKRGHLLRKIDEAGSVENLIASLYETLNVAQGSSRASIIATFCSQDPTDLRLLLNDLLTSTSKTDLKNADILARWCSTSTNDRIDLFPSYCSIFITSTGAPRKITGIITKKHAAKQPAALAIAEAQLLIVINILEEINSATVAHLTSNLLYVAEAIFSIYKKLKDHRAYMDYDDLIFYSQRLLNNETIAPWVMYKLDGGIDHLLVDEAQDTSPNQWNIVRMLCAEFFAGAGQEKDENRTIFVVGDEKQSIFSFQGADPDVFEGMRDFFSNTIKHANKSWQPVSLALSFRSTSPILDLTDHVFHANKERKAITNIASRVKHQAFRANEAGLVELWPLITPEAKQKDTATWKLPITITSSTDAKTVLADNIASTIAGWIKNKRMLKSKGRAVQAGDVLILVRRRNELVDQILRSLQRHDIPVAGIDRMTLTDHICVMDMIALGKWLLQPNDDLTLAAILRSPICGLTDEQLFGIAHGRGKQSLWYRLRESNKQELSQTIKFLEFLLKKYHNFSPFELYNYVLDIADKRTNFISRMGQEVQDPLKEFINLTLQYSTKHTSTMQGFIRWVEAGKLEVKRDFDQGNNEVRIMTVHGSKGLQAPIVFLPDTTALPTNKSKLMWTPNGHMLWPGAASNRNQLCNTLLEQQKQRDMNEYLRLFYVGLTRPEDELYICGYTGANKLNDESWYALAQVQMQEHGSAVFSDALDSDVFQIASDQVSRPKQQIETKTAEQAISLPDFAKSQPKSEPTPTSPLTPSRPNDSENDLAFSSPLQQSKQFERGNFVHSLLEILPSVPAHKRESAAQHIALKYPETMRKKAVEEVFSIINNPEFAPLFGENSRAEIPLSGIIDNRVVNGQVDRLVITEEEVLIIDYKTNQLPPSSSATIPETYKKQMAAYHSLLSNIYPEKNIRTFLLWTQNMHMMEV